MEHTSEQLSAVELQYEEQLKLLNDTVLSRSMKLENHCGEEYLSSERSEYADTTLADLKERLAHTQTSLTEAHQRSADLE